MTSTNPIIGLFFFLILANPSYGRPVKTTTESKSGTYVSSLPGTLAYQEWGHPDATPLVFIHG